MNELTWVAGVEVSPERVLDALPDACLVIDAEARLRWANRAAEELFGWSFADWRGRNGLELVHPADIDLVLGAMVTVQQKAVGTPLEVRVRTEAGWRVVEVIGRDASDDAGVGGIVLVLRDLTERRRWEIARDDSARTRAVIHNSPTMNFLIDEDSRICAVSGAVTRLLGHDPEALEGRRIDDIVAESDRGLVLGALEVAANDGVGSVARPVTTRVRMLGTHGGAVLAAELAVVSLADDPVLDGYIVSAQDVTALTEATEALSALAHRDQVTGLANRIAALEHLTRALADHSPGLPPVTVVFLDLDGFKAVNDSYGHDAGDELLTAVGARFATVVRHDDLVARYAGDEFVVVARAEPAVAGTLVNRLTASLVMPFELAAGTARVTASAGVAIAEPGDTPASLIARADQAMYARKRAKLPR